ncbi:hypothetical protein OKW30_002547 [Paraburkholderia sp. Clong3]
MSENKSVGANIKHDLSHDRVPAADVDGIPGVSAGEPHSVPGWVDVAHVDRPTDPEYSLAGGRKR